MQLGAAVRTTQTPLGAGGDARRRRIRRLGGLFVLAALAVVAVAPAAFAASRDAAAPAQPSWNAAAGIIALATGPQTTASAAAGQSFADWHNHAVTVNLTATSSAAAVASIEYWIEGGGHSQVNTATVSVPVAAPASFDGEVVLNFFATDASDTVESPTKSQAVKFDTIVPTGTFDVPDTTLLPGISGTSAVTDGHDMTMRFSVDGGASWGAWAAYGPSADLTLPAGGGTKTVKAEYRDLAGNVLQLTDTTQITDTTPPVTTRTDGQDLTAYYNTPVTLTFSGADEAGGSGMSGGYAKTEYQVDGGAWTSGTSATVPAAAGDDSAHTVGYRSVDAAGNTETAQTVSVNIDALAPAGRISMEGGAAYTSSLTVTAESSITEAHGPVQMRFSTDGSTWTDWAEYAAVTTHELSGAEGVKTLSAEYRDAVGNVGQITDTIVYAEGSTPGSDTTPPVTTPTGADALWHNKAVTITFTAADNSGGSGMSGGSAKTEYRVDSGVWTAGTSVVIPAPVDHSNDGLHTVSYRSTDNIGNIEADKSTKVRIDTTPPAGGFILNGGAASTNSVVVRYDAQVTDVNTPLEQRFSSDGKATWTTWAPYSATGTVTITAGAGLKTVVGQFRDPAGNVLEYADDIQLLVSSGDTIAPTVTISGVQDGGWYTQSILVQLSAADNTGGTGMAYISYNLDGLSQVYPGGRAALTVLRDPNATHILTYRASDLAGNSTAPRTITFTIDTRGPTTTAKATTGRVNRTIKLPYQVFDTMSSNATVTIVVKNSAGRTVKTLRPGVKAAGPTWYTASWKPSARGTYRYYVKAMDVAGNAQARTGSAKVTVR